MFWVVNPVLGQERSDYPVFRRLLTIPPRDLSSSTPDEIATVASLPRNDCDLVSAKADTRRQPVRGLQSGSFPRGACPERREGLGTGAMNVFSIEPGPRSGAKRLSGPRSAVLQPSRDILPSYFSIFNLQFLISKLISPTKTSDPNNGQIHHKSALRGAGPLSPVA